MHLPKRALAALAFVLALSPEVSRATDAVVDTTFSGQFYTVRSPYGEPVVRRRRYTHTLGLQVVDMLSRRDLEAPQLSFRSRLRLDADFGQLSAERDPEVGGRFVPGLEEAPLDLMYAYLEGRGFFGGWAGFRLGRQYVVDALGFWSFDGLSLQVDTPVYVRFEAYGGFEQRGALPMLSTARFEADGVYRGSREELGRDQYPSLLAQERLAPAMGLAVEASGIQWLHARLSYRRVLNRDRVRLTPLPDPVDGNYRFFDETRISSERLGYALSMSDAELGTAGGSLVYDLYLLRVTSYEAKLDWFALPELTVGIGGDYWYPTFDADSIFNWFSHNGVSSAKTRAAIAVSERIDVAADAGVRLYQGQAADAEASSSLDYVTHASGRYRWPSGVGRVTTIAEVGDRGHRAGGDVSVEQQFLGGYYDTLVVLSLYDWKDALRPERHATSVTYVLGGGVSPSFALFGDARLGVEWEHTINRLVGHRFRALGTLDLSVY